MEKSNNQNDLFYKILNDYIMDDNELSMVKK